jgi:hypothetical protein
VNDMVEAIERWPIAVAGEVADWRGRSGQTMWSLMKMSPRVLNLTKGFYN